MTASAIDGRKPGGTADNVICSLVCSLRRKAGWRRRQGIMMLSQHKQQSLIMLTCCGHDVRWSPTLYDAQDAEFMMGNLPFAQVFVIHTFIIAAPME